jgi:hypothetical protein
MLPAVPVAAVTSGDTPYGVASPAIAPTRARAERIRDDDDDERPNMVSRDSVRLAWRSSAMVAVGSTLSVLGGIYSLLAGIAVTQELGAFNLIPLAGPILDAGTDPTRGFRSNTGLALAVVTIPSVITQGIGLAVLIAGIQSSLRLSSRRNRNTARAHRPQWTLAPGASGTTAGLSLALRF